MPQKCQLMPKNAKSKQLGKVFLEQRPFEPKLQKKHHQKVSINRKKAHSKGFCKVLGKVLLLKKFHTSILCDFPNKKYKTKPRS